MYLCRFWFLLIIIVIIKSWFATILHDKLISVFSIYEEHQRQACESKLKPIGLYKFRLIPLLINIVFIRMPVWNTWITTGFSCVKGLFTRNRESLLILARVHLNLKVLKQSKVNSTESSQDHCFEIRKYRIFCSHDTVKSSV